MRRRCGPAAPGARPATPRRPRARGPGRSAPAAGTAAPSSRRRPPATEGSRPPRSRPCRRSPGRRRRSPGRSTPTVVPMPTPVRRSSPTSPAIHTAAMSGLKMSRVSTTYWTAPPAPPYSSLISPESTKTGQPCWACQTQVRQPQQQRHPAAGPPPGRAEVVTDRGGGGDPDEQAEQRDHHVVLGVQAEAGHQPGEQPQPRAVVDERVRRDQGEGRPRQEAHRARLEQVAEGEHHAAAGEHHGHQHLRPGAATEQPRPGRPSSRARRRRRARSACAGPAASGRRGPGSPGRAAPPWTAGRGSPRRGGARPRRSTARRGAGRSRGEHQQDDGERHGDDGDRLPGERRTPLHGRSASWTDHGRLQRGGGATYDVGVELEHLAVPGEQPVQLVLDVAELGVDGGGEAFARPRAPAARAGQRTAPRRRPRRRGAGSRTRGRTSRGPRRAGWRRRTPSGRARGGPSSAASRTG